MIKNLIKAVVLGITLATTFHFWVTYSGIDLSNKVSEVNKEDTCIFIFSLALLAGLSVLVAFGIVDFLWDLFFKHINS